MAMTKTCKRFGRGEQGLQTNSLEQILLSQIEHHRTEVFYNLDPMRYGSSFVTKLPGCVKKSVCWRAAPSGGADLTKYDLVVCNFHSILDDWPVGRKLTRSPISFRRMIRRWIAMPVRGVTILI